ncbi:MAG: hypothetical protein J6S67_23110 [Methanobrevibacter sp.]|nr:hypothetical protein [Methanobrevibacter sp.]
MDLIGNPRITKFAQKVDGEITVLKLNNEQDAYEQIYDKGKADGQAGVKLENNHTETIDVSTYTEPIVIEPASGKDGMKKVTITLTGIE